MAKGETKRKKMGWRKSKPNHGKKPCMGKRRGRR